MNPMIAFARLTKVDEEKRLVYGRAAQEVPDRANEKLDYTKSKPFFLAWSKSQLEASMGKSAGNIREMHSKTAAGIVTPDGLILNDEEHAIDIVVKVVDDGAWKKVTEGVFTGFSIGGRYVEKSAPDKDGVVTYVGDISEISLVDRPAVPTATFFEVQKADGKVEKREFQKPVMRKLVRRDGVDLGKEVDDRDLPKPGEEFDHAGQRYLFAKTENGRAYVDEVYELIGSPEELQAFAKLMTERGMTIAAATALLKSEPADDAAVLGKAAQLAQDTDKKDFKKLTAEEQKPYISAAKAELSKAAAPKEGERKYGNVTFADEKNKKYPIDSEAHIRAAWSYINMPKNAAKYSADELKTVKGKIKSAAKAKGIQINEKLDGGEVATEHDGAISKAMLALYEPADAELTVEVTRLAKAANVDMEKIEDPKAKATWLETFSKDAVKALYGKITDEAKAALRKRAESAVLRKGLFTCAVFANLLDQLCQMAESVEMESAREGDDSGICDTLYTQIAGLGETLRDMVAEEVAEEVNGDSMAYAARAGELVKYIEALRKASHVAVSYKRVQKMHDGLVSMGAKCAAVSNAMTQNAVLAAAEGTTGDLKKAADAGNEFAKALIASQEALVKATEANAKLDERLQKLEKQPMPARVALRAVSKEADVAEPVTLESRAMKKAVELAATVQPVLKADGSIDEVATATKIMRTVGGVAILK